MKKMLLFNIVLILLICGCSKNKIIYLNKNNISNILYGENKIISNDFDDVLSKINRNDYNELYITKTNGNKLVIECTDKSHEFEILDNFIIYKEDGKSYYSRSDKIRDYITKIIEKYTDKSIFNIEYIPNYDINNSDYLVKLDESQNYVVIKTNINIYDFKIVSDSASKIESQIDKIENNKIICIETNNIDTINISFKNPYDYNYIVSYDNEFKTNIYNPK